ncbi:MAG: histidine kinase [Lachnospiraceae bacterium]|nr:histidine kinase [Lachnospiraceae bacterium]MBP3458544.1 histidine kinase [Lachnospiraceae bacterium]
MGYQEKDLQELKSMQEELQAGQLNQHFIFNALNTIKCATIIDRRQACHLIDEFSKYLRYNLNAMENGEAVPFRNEMEQVKAYGSIEMARFAKVQVEYDLQEEDFFIPPLSVQPLVENVIQNGLCKAEEGGKVIIRSFCEEEKYVIEIVLSSTISEEEEEMKYHPDQELIDHIRIRLEKLMNGTLKLENEPEKEIKFQIAIPVENARNREYGKVAGGGRTD